MALTDVGTDPAQTLIHEANELAAKAERLVLERVDGLAWDQAASAFDQIAQEQLYSFAHSRWPGVQLEPLLFRANGEVVGGTLMMVQPLDEHGADTGDAYVAVDRVQCGPGDRVLVLTEGNGARQIFKRGDILPIRSVVIGVVDEVDVP